VLTFEAQRAPLSQAGFDLIQAHLSESRERSHEAN